MEKKRERIIKFVKSSNYLMRHDVVYLGTVAVFLKQSKIQSRRKKTIEGPPHPAVITTQDWIFHWHLGWEYIFSFSYPEVTSPAAKVQGVFSAPSSWPHVATVLMKREHVHGNRAWCVPLGGDRVLFWGILLIPENRAPECHCNDNHITIFKCVTSARGKTYICICCVWNTFHKHILYVKGRARLCELSYCWVILYNESMFTHISQEPNNLPLLHELGLQQLLSQWNMGSTLGICSVSETSDSRKRRPVIYLCYTLFLEDENSRACMYFLMIQIQYVTFLLAIL